MPRTSKKDLYAAVCTAVAGGEALALARCNAKLKMAEKRLCQRCSGAVEIANFVTPQLPKGKLPTDNLQLYTWLNASEEPGKRFVGRWKLLHTATTKEGGGFERTSDTTANINVSVDISPSAQVSGVTSYGRLSSSTLPFRTSSDGGLSCLKTSMQDAVDFLNSKEPDQACDALFARNNLHTFKITPTIFTLESGVDNGMAVYSAGDEKFACEFEGEEYPGTFTAVQLYASDGGQTKESFDVTFADKKLDLTGKTTVYLSKHEYRIGYCKEIEDLAQLKESCLQLQLNKTVLEHDKFYYVVNKPDVEHGHQLTKTEYYTDEVQFEYAKTWKEEMTRRAAKDTWLPLTEMANAVGVLSYYGIDMREKNTIDVRLRPLQEGSEMEFMVKRHSPEMTNKNTSEKKKLHEILNIKRPEDYVRVKAELNFEIPPRVDEETEHLLTATFYSLSLKVGNPKGSESDLLKELRGVYDNWTETKKAGESFWTMLTQPVESLQGAGTDTAKAWVLEYFACDEEQCDIISKINSSALSVLAKLWLTSGTITRNEADNSITVKLGKKLNE